MKSVKLISLVLLVCISLSNLAFAQTDAEKAQIQVHVINATSALQNSNWDQALSNINRAQDLLGNNAAIFESIRVKAYHGKKDYQKAKEHLLIFFQLSPADNLIAEIAPISADIDYKLEAEIKRAKEKSAAIEQDIKRRSGEIYYAQDNAVYPTIRIGNQVWFSKNLNTSVLRDGTSIKEAKSTSEWSVATRSKQPVWSYYDFDEKNQQYGKLYNWYAVNTGQLCPSGFHIPSNDEFLTLRKYLGSDKIAGKLKNTTGWERTRNKNGDNESGFSSLPGGGRSLYSFVYKDYSVDWWSSTEYWEDRSAAIYWQLLGHSDEFMNKTQHKSYGSYIRCLKD